MLGYSLRSMAWDATGLLRIVLKISLVSHYLVQRIVEEAEEKTEEKAKD